MTIQGLEVNPLKKIKKNSGSVLQMIRSDSPQFLNFGEIYFSYVNPGFVKGWKLHKKLYQNFAVPVGEVKFVFFDVRENSSTKGAIVTHEIGLNNYQLISVPSGIWYSFASNNEDIALIANCASTPHDPGESIIADLNDKKMPAVWDRQRFQPG